MSHFSVMVITEGYPTEDVLSRALQPWHEFECTGINGEYVLDVDITEEARENYEKDTTCVYVNPDGEIFDAYMDCFYRYPTAEEKKKVGVMVGTGCGGGLMWTSKDWGDGRGYQAKVHFLPEGFTEQDVPTKTRKSFVEFIDDYYGIRPVDGPIPELDYKHKYGYVLLDKQGSVAKVVDRTNPNRKWDWWVVGGRWKGFLRVNGSNAPLDIAQMSNIDWEAMHQAEMSRAEKSWSEYEAEGKNGFIWGINKDETKEHYIARMEVPATFAVVKNGQWLERGEMGWFGLVADEKACKTWQEEWSELLEDVPGDHWVTVVDCHI